jgi:hypothetical protein
MAKPDFAKELVSAVTEAENLLDSQYRKSVIDVFNRIVIATPFDKGQAQRSWLVGSTNDGAIGTVKLSLTVSDINRIPQSTTLYSNLPYMKRLSEGWSAQRGNGWIQDIVLTWPQTVKKFEGKNG